MITIVHGQMGFLTMPHGPWLQRIWSLIQVHAVCPLGAQGGSGFAVLRPGREGGPVA